MKALVLSVFAQRTLSMPSWHPCSSYSSHVVQMITVFDMRLSYLHIVLGSPLCLHDSLIPIPSTTLAPTACSVSSGRVAMALCTDTTTDHGTTQ